LREIAGDGEKRERGRLGDGVHTLVSTQTWNH
jgi:hypothetical protein